jgi:hypothetical protein
MRRGAAGDRPGHPMRVWLATASLVLAAVFALGRVSQETALASSSRAPASPLPLRVTEPPDGAIIPGRSVRVAVARNASAGPAGSPLEPDVLVFLDGAQRATIPAGQSSVTIDDVSPGRHKLTLVAGGQGGQALDRKDVSLTTAAVAAPAAGPAEPVSSTASNGLPAIAPPGLLVALSALVLLTLGTSLLASRRRARQ